MSEGCVIFVFEDGKTSIKNIPTHFTGGIAVLMPEFLVTSDQVGPSN